MLPLVGYETRKNPTIIPNNRKPRTNKMNWCSKFIYDVWYSGGQATFNFQLEIFSSDEYHELVPEEFRLSIGCLTSKPLIEIWCMTSLTCLTTLSIVSIASCRASQPSSHCAYFNISWLVGENKNNLSPAYEQHRKVFMGNISNASWTFERMFIQFEGNGESSGDGIPPFSLYFKWWLPVPVKQWLSKCVQAGWEKCGDAAQFKLLSMRDNRRHEIFKHKFNYFISLDF